MPVAGGDVSLVADDAERLGRGRQDVEHGVVGLAAGPGDVERLLQGHLPQPGLDGLDRHLHRQEAADLVFGQVQDGHRGLGAATGVDYQWYQPADRLSRT